MKLKFTIFPILALSMFSHNSFAQNNTKSLQKIEQYAEDGNLLAQVLLGEMYVSGQEVTKDYSKAKKWFEKAAVQGNAESEYNFRFIIL